MNVDERDFNDELKKLKSRIEAIEQYIIEKEGEI
jgi:hypothetical protein